MRHAAPVRWEALAAEPEFRILLRARRRFAIPASIFFIGYYLALPISVGFFPNVMSRPIWGALTVAYVFALSQFVMSWMLLVLYLRIAHGFDLRAARMRRLQTHELLDAQR